MGKSRSRPFPEMKASDFLPVPKFPSSRGNQRGMKNPFPIFETVIRGSHSREWLGAGIPVHPWEDAEMCAAALSKFTTGSSNSFFKVFLSSRYFNIAMLTEENLTKMHEKNRLILYFIRHTACPWSPSLYPFSEPDVLFSLQRYKVLELSETVFTVSIRASYWLSSNYI